MFVSMRKKFAALIAVVLLGLPIGANALETDELIALTAMPLVVAAAAELTDVPTDELMSVVSTLNNAQVRPTQFVEVVRYAPVAIVSSTEPRFSTYVTTEYARGVVGDPLAIEIAERYPTYGVAEEIHIVDPPVVTYVERQEILPQYVVTRFEAQPVDPLALIAMPLAVAAVAETTDVPASDLISFIAALNRARMPAPQFVEVVRYSPVVLVDTTERPVFLRYVTTQVDRGVIGRPLAFALADRIGIEDIARPRVIIDRDRDVDILPTVVTTRVATTRSHPHGGPPGQLKKERGLQTGAEVVHGTRRAQPERVTRNRVSDDRPRVESKPAKAQRVAKPQRVKVKPQHVAKAKVSKPQHGSKGQGGGGGGGKGHGNSGGGKGKGKGKG
jgi:uncharacterized membrane protein YgcG